MIENSWNVIYKVTLKEGLTTFFESREDAVEFATENVDELPEVVASEVFVDENGITTEEGESEVILSTITDSDKRICEESKEDRLAELEAEIGKEEQEAEVSSDETVEIPVETEPEECCDEPMPVEMPENPFELDFDKPEIAKEEFVDYLQELVNSLGLELVSKEPKDDEVVLVADVPSEVADKITGDEIKVEIPVESDTVVASAEPIAVEAPREGENCDPHCAAEEPAKEISDCRACPTCGKEICDCTKLEESQSQEIGQTYRNLNKYYGYDIEELVYGPEGFMKTVYPNGFEDFKGDIIFSQKHWEEFENWLKETKGINLEEVRASKEGTTFESLDEPTKTNPDDWKTDLLDSEADREEEFNKLISEWGDGELTEASSAEKKAYKHGGQDQIDLEQGKAIARIHDPKARDAAIAAVKADRPEVAHEFIGDRKLSQAEQSLADKMQKMQDADVKDESLEGTVESDLSDVRQPVEISEPEVKDEPVDYKAEVAKEKGLEEFYDHEDHTVESDQELSGTDNAVVDCEVAKVVAHSEDEKPLDCKMEKAPLEKPLTEEEDMSDLELAEKLEAAIKEKRANK